MVSEDDDVADLYEFDYSKNPTTVSHRALYFKQLQTRSLYLLGAGVVRKYGLISL